VPLMVLEYWIHYKPYGIVLLKSLIYKPFSGWGVYGFNRQTTRGEDTWPSLLPPGASTGVPSLYHHLMILNSWSSLLGFHSLSAWCYYLATRFVGILMGMGWTKSQSHHQSSYGGFRPESWSAKAHSSPWPPKSRPPPDFGASFYSGSSFCSPPGPRLPTSLHGFCSVIASDWSHARRATTLTFLTFSIWFQVAISMPRLRGKSKRGATWYAARGRAARGRGSPPETEFASTPTPIVAPTPAPPTRDNTPDLSPLSNPFACRVEWFDSLRNSLGFAPPP
jgi:hypothetical protein